MRKLVEDGYNTAKAVIAERREAMVRIAEALLEREVLDGAEVLDLINGKELPKMTTAPKMPSANPPDSGIVIGPHPSSVPGLLGGESPQPA